MSLYPILKLCTQPWTGGDSGGVSSIVAGANVSISPTDGLGDVTVNVSDSTGVSTIQAGTGISVSSPTGIVTISNTSVPPVTKLIQGANITLTPSNGLGDVTISASGGGSSPSYGIFYGTLRQQIPAANVNNGEAIIQFQKEIISTSDINPTTSLIPNGSATNIVVSIAGVYKITATTALYEQVDNINHNIWFYLKINNVRRADTTFPSDIQSDQYQTKVITQFNLNTIIPLSANDNVSLAVRNVTVNSPIFNVIGTEDVGGPSDITDPAIFGTTYFMIERLS